MRFDFEYEKLIKELKEKDPKKVLVQLPEGIKSKAFEIERLITNLGIECVFSGDSCWGGCAIAVDEAKKINADLIVHFGHAEYIRVNFPVIYIEIKDLTDLNPLLKKSVIKLRRFKRIGLSYSIQHRHELENIRKFYEKNGKEVFISKKSGRVAYPGHVVGCMYYGLKLIEKNVDAFVVIGNVFHSLGAALSVKKPVFLIDVYNGKIEDMSEKKDRIVKQRIAAIEKFKNAKKIGIIIEMKVGQKFGNPDFVKERLKKDGKEAIVLIMNEITEDKLNNFNNIEAFVELACPRIAIEDYSRFKKPVLTAKEMMVALNDLSFEEFIEKGII